MIVGLSFYQRKEIKDVLGYFRFVLNQHDDDAFQRITIPHHEKTVGRSPQHLRSG
ncbi:MAG: 3'-5' exonuclease [Aquirufa sp.]